MKLESDEEQINQGDSSNTILKNDLINIPVEIDQINITKNH